MAALLEYLPLLLFFIVYKLVDIYWATGILILGSTLQIIHHYTIHQSVSPRYWAFFTVAVVLGGMTIFFQDEQFIKWKATIIFASLGIALLISNYIFKKNLTKSMLESIINNAAKSEDKNATAITLPEKLCVKMNIAWSSLLFCIAALNIYIAYYFSLDVWVNFKIFGLMGIMVLAIIATIFTIYEFLPEDKNEET